MMFWRPGIPLPCSRSRWPLVRRSAVAPVPGRARWPPSPLRRCPHGTKNAGACPERSPGERLVEGVLRQMEADGQEESQSQATRLVAMATNAGVELFHTPEDEPYATIEVDGHKETWPLKVRRFRRWLAGLFLEEEDKVPGSQAVQDALAVLEGKALKGQELPVFIRLAEHQGTIYLDLGNAAWQAVEITSRGWQVIDKPPVKFRRAKGLVPFDEPGRGGTLAALRPFINVGSEADWRLLVSWLLAALRPTGPYP